MDEMPSTEFRRRYASLRTPTLVTVSGHVIGEWRPIVTVKDSAGRELGEAIVYPGGGFEPISGPAFNSRPFRPVPKGK